MTTTSRPPTGSDGVGKGGAAAPPGPSRSHRPSPRERFAREKARVREGAGKDRQEKLRAQGRLAARERLETLFDPGTFVEIDPFVSHRITSFGLSERRIPGDGVVTGWGKIEGRVVAAFAQDPTVFGGALGEAHASKIVKIMEFAAKVGAPVVGLNDSGGARIQEGVVSLGGYGEVFHRNVLYSGVVPQVSVILGACAGGAVYSPAMTDFIIMAEGASHMFITGPDVIRTVTGEEVTHEQLGGAHTHASKSGVAHLVAPGEKEALALTRRLLSYLPSNNLEDPPSSPPRSPPPSAAGELDALVPAEADRPYDMHEVIGRVVDPESTLEIFPSWAPNMITELARLDGHPVGVVANQPQVLAGCLDIEASEKGARFVRTCDAFNLPLLTFVDVPGFLPGTQQEYGGIIRHGAKLLFAFSEATVPKLTVIPRKAYGGAYDVMCSKHIGGDYNVAWPQAEIAVMGAEGAVNILFRRELDKAPEGERSSLRKTLTDEYAAEFLNPYLAAERGYLDDVIDPSETRKRLLEAFEALRGKRQDRPPKKHGNIPL
ncbi:MAG: acyl-CoA carboxylase subunit beta [Euryarchaeota archaeon]|nr:acyl-CoA carboxylase subunit beta [Euryarchaeota archaeon]MDE1836075.1 acyl-CoA carboxylase subunit beta [Euryarchaeota archaeon]MDE1879977.1 acyl-CoA carboxylase subunit beta [Euryarchaeota archaeon]MDE2044053.1 acyl-CoA carboxylase subunit beta [Thermoplasmata archaeon]